MTEEHRYTCKRCGSEFGAAFVMREQRCRQCGHNEFTLVHEGPVKCDFCSSTKVEWRYPCRDFRQEITPASGAMWGSREFWAACGPCHRLIQRGDSQRSGR